MTEDVLRRQLSILEAEDNLVVAYEPVWAIGTERPQLPKSPRTLTSSSKTLDVPVLYGGSVKPENAEEAPEPAGRRRRARRRRLARRRIVCLDLPERKPLVALIILDVGARTGRPRKRSRAGGHAGLRPSLGRVPAHDAEGFQ